MATETRINERMLNEVEAAEMLGLRPGTLNVWRSTRRVNIPFVKIGRAVRYRMSDLHDFIAKRTVNADVHRE